LTLPPAALVQASARYLLAIAALSWLTVQILGTGLPTLH